jgi:Single-strand binding protein family
MSMAADNHTTIVGNLVDDPELRFANTGIAVANWRVAVTQRIQQDGEWRDGGRHQGPERQAERGGDFNDARRLIEWRLGALGLQP